MNPQHWIKKLSAAKKYSVSGLEIPALTVDARGGIVEYSPAALPIVQAYEAQHTGVHGIIGEMDSATAVVESRLELTPLAYWVAGVLLENGHILLVARDISNDERLLQAYMASRELYSELIRCAADFGWETDESGAIVYIGPDAGMGWNGLDISGQDAWHLFCPDTTRAGKTNPFVAKEKQDINAVLMTGKSGEQRRMRVTSVPKLDLKGRWVGSRGVCRDVTVEYETALSARRMNARNALYANIIAAMRTHVGAKELLAASAKAIAEVLRADASWIVRPHAKKTVYTGVEELKSLSDDIVHICSGLSGWRDNREECKSVTVAGREMKMLTVSGKDEVEGVIVITRDTRQFPWREYEMTLMKDIFEHLGLALRQAALFDRLEYLSTIDELTGLYNRRAFSRMVNKRIAAQKRNCKPACLLYIDLDYFKETNDTLGHAAGDGVLRFLGEILMTKVRASDIGGRLGGDEFALWLEDTDVNGARAKAEELISFSPKLRKAAGDEMLRLSMSNGVACTDINRENSFETLSATADEALYKAKKLGKGTVAVADAEQGRQGQEGIC